MAEKVQKPTLVIVRHGDTILNDENKLRGWLDPDLNSEGVQSAKDAAQRIADSGISLHHIYTGTLKRTQETGRYISEATNTPTSATESLNPWDYGDITNKPEDRQQRKNLKFFQNRPNIKTPNGESFSEFLDRYRPTLTNARDFVMANPDKPIALVTHSRNLYPTANLLGDSAAPIPTKSDEFGPGSVHVYTFEPDGKFSKTKL